MKTIGISISNYAETEHNIIKQLKMNEDSKIIIWEKINDKWSPIHVEMI